MTNIVIKPLMNHKIEHVCFLFYFSHLEVQLPFHARQTSGKAIRIFLTQHRSFLLSRETELRMCN